MAGEAALLAGHLDTARRDLTEAVELHRESGGDMPSVAAYGNAFGGPAASGWAVLAGSALVLTIATMWVLHRRCLPGRSTPHRR